MARFPRTLKELCTPAALYFIISIAGLMAMGIQNVGNTDNYQVGNFSCRVPNTLFVLFSQLLYILFWTYVLNLICKDGHVGISWLLVLLPWLVMFVFIGLIMLNM